MGRDHVVVVGAGPGGLAAAMLLAARGYQVEVFEQQPFVGGRCSRLELDGFTFDLGPTFLEMKPILAELFARCGRVLDDELEIDAIDPLYRLVLGDGREWHPTTRRDVMREELERLFPGSFPGYLRFLRDEEKKYQRLLPLLRRPFASLGDYLQLDILRAIPYFDAHRSLYQHLGRYFRDPTLRLCFTFQAKYLGMSPWRCPSIFSILSYLEHSGGVHHPRGGLHRICEVMADAVRASGGKIHLGRGVRQIRVRDGRAVGVELAGGDFAAADHLVLGADFGHAVTHLFPPGSLKTWTPTALERKRLSCSTFMIYLGVEGRYEVPHHTIVFAADYRRNLTEITEDDVLSADPSFYLQNAGVTDPSLAPAGHSTLYLLVPVPNTRAPIDWAVEGPRYREKILDLAERRAGLPGLKQRIRVERVITPREWESERLVYRGAAFNLAHGLGQTLALRPHNRFEDIGSTYLVGGGTHPGSGLPTIFLSGMIAAKLIEADSRA